MRRSVRWAATAATALFLLGACGSSTNGVEDLSATQILDKTKAAVADATTVHLSGSIDTGSSTIDVDLTLTADGEAGGTIANGDQVITLLAVGGTTWYSANAAFWSGKVGPAKVAKVADKYIKLPKGDSSFDQFTDWDGFWKGALSAEGTVKKGDVTEFDGKQTIQLIDSKDQGILFVSLEGEPLPLGVKSGTDKGTMTLSDWNEPVALEPPSDKDVVDLSTIGS